MQYNFVGQLDPRIFHTINIVLHVINSLLSLVVIIIILSEGEHCGNLRSETKEGILLASSLFAVHPIHTESVSNSSFFICSTINEENVLISKVRICIPSLSDIHTQRKDFYSTVLIVLKLPQRMRYKEK